MTPGMLDSILEFHHGENRRTYGQVAAAAGNVMRSSDPLSPYDFFHDLETGGRPRQTVAQQIAQLQKFQVPAGPRIQRKKS